MDKYWTLLIFYIHFRSWLQSLHATRGKDHGFWLQGNPFRRGNKDKQLSTNNKYKVECGYNTDYESLRKKREGRIRKVCRQGSIWNGLWSLRIHTERDGNNFHEQGVEVIWGKLGLWQSNSSFPGGREISESGKGFHQDRHLNPLDSERKRMP